MTISPDRTLRLYNTDPAGMDISIQIRMGHARVQPRLRRGGAVRNIKIARQGYFDLCRDLGVSLREAEYLVLSPMVQAFRRAGRLSVRHHPPLETELVDEAAQAEVKKAAVAKQAALQPADPPTAIPAGVNPEALGLPRDTPRMTSAPLRTSPKTEAARDEEAAAAKAAAEVIKSAETVSAAELNVAETETESNDVERPSMRWTRRRLTAHAEAMGLDLSDVASKTAVLKKIKAAG